MGGWLPTWPPLWTCKGHRSDLPLTFVWTELSCYVRLPEGASCRTTLLPTTTINFWLCLVPSPQSYQPAPQLSLVSSPHYYQPPLTVSSCQPPELSSLPVSYFPAPIPVKLQFNLVSTPTTVNPELCLVLAPTTVNP